MIREIFQTGDSISLRDSFPRFWYDIHSDIDIGCSLPMPLHKECNMAPTKGVILATIAAKKKASL